jgi:hypothetical protein
MAIYIGDKEVTMAYLGSNTITNTQGGFYNPTGSVPTDFLDQWFVADRGATATSWQGFPGRNITFSSASITYVSDTPSSSYYDFSGSGVLNEMYFGTVVPLASSDRTILLWIKPQNIDNQQIIVMQGQSNTPPATDNANYLVISGSELGFINNNDQNSVPTGSGLTIELDKWQQVAYTEERSTNTVVVYKNTQGYTVPPVSLQVDNTYWLVGGENGLNLFSGSLAVQLVYRKVLSPEEIESIYLYYSQFYQ